MAASAASTTTVRPHQPNRTGDRVFFSVMPLVMWAMVLYGFAKTYFLAGMIAAPLPNKLIHIHGAVFTLWMVLLVVQTALVSTKNVRLHMKLGLFGFGWAVLMVVVGLMAAVDALHRGEAPLGLDAVTFFIIPVSSILLFAVLIFCAFRWKSNKEAHKRLIIVATISLMDAAVGRWPVAVLQAHPPYQDFVLFALLLVMVAYDLVSLRRFSKVTLWASLLVVVVHLTRVPIGLHHPWHALVQKVFL